MYVCVSKHRNREQPADTVRVYVFPPLAPPIFFVRVCVYIYVGMYVHMYIYTGAIKLEHQAETQLTWRTWYHC